MLYGNRIKQIREYAGMTQEKFGETTGINKQVLYNFEKDRSEPSNKFLCALSDKFNVNINWLIKGEGEMFLGGDTTDLSLDNVKIKLIDVVASAGAGIVNYEEEYDWIGVPKDLIAPYNPNNINIIKVKGESMEPIIYPGDYLIIDSNIQDIISERIFIIRMEDELRVKRLEKRTGQKVAICSENPRFSTEEIPLTEFKKNVRILGQVLKVIHQREV